MFFVVRGSKRFALTFAILLGVLSTGFVIAHQCQSMSINKVAMHDDPSNINSAPVVVSEPLIFPSDSGRLIYRGCTIFFIFVLLFGRKLLNLRALRSRYCNWISLSFKLVPVYLSQVFHLALTRSQLGIIRI